MNVRPRLLWALVVVLAGALWLATAADADIFSGAWLLSDSPFGQAEYAHSPAIAEDGDWVVFEGSVGGVKGIWRRQVNPANPSETHPLEQVAGGEAALPSVSADGQYVSFTSREGESLPAITNGEIDAPAPLEHPGVYVRNMDIPADRPCPHAVPHEACAFTLVSAKNHSTESLSYEYPNPEHRAAEEIQEGSVAAGRSAISAEGNEVAFVTTATSDLAGAGTPPLQVAVRNLETEETQLVSVVYDQSTGAPATNPETGEPVPVPDQEGFGAVLANKVSFVGEISGSQGTVSELPGASISGNGKVVTWYGQQLGYQVQGLPGAEVRENARASEPLWRRADAGQSVPTMRVAGGPDPESPACQADPESALPDEPSASDPCQGPFATQNDKGWGVLQDSAGTDPTPSISYDGGDVAFLASAPTVGSGKAYEEGARDDAYWIELGQPDRLAALRQLTSHGTGEGRVATQGLISDLAISPDGGQVAFTTQRTEFPLSTPAYVSTQAATPGLSEVYDADILDETLTRVTTSYEGGLDEQPHRESFEKEDQYYPYQGAFSPSFSAEGASLVFSSTSSNLVYGDGNTPPLGFESEYRDGADAFLVKRDVFIPEPSEQTISPAPAAPTLTPPWTLSAKVSSLPDGSIRLTLRLPGAGTVQTRATSSLTLARTARDNGRRRTVERAVALAKRTVDGASTTTVTMTIALAPAYRSLAARRDGLTAKLLIDFTASGHPTIARTIAVRFQLRGKHGSRR